jgi:hypothetical protein
LNIYFKTRVVDGIIGWIVFMVYDIDIHQLNLGKFRNLKFLYEIWFKKCVFLYLFNNECIIIPFLRKKTTNISKRKFYRLALYYFFNFFCLVIFHESWGPMVAEKL